MALENINRALLTHDFVHDIKWNPSLRAEFEANEKAVFDRYSFTAAEREALEKRDFRALYAMGLHPYLGAQLARILYRSHSRGGSAAARALNASLNGRPLPDDVDPNGVN